MSEPVTTLSIARMAMASLCVNPFGLTDAEIAAAEAKRGEECECCGQPLTESEFA